MSNIFSGISGRFRAAPKNGQGKVSSPTTGNGQGQPSGPQLNTSASSGNLAPRISPVPQSPSLSSTMAAAGGPVDPNDPLLRYSLPMPRPMWLNENYSKHIVKGNFMTLSTKPRTLEHGEWVAHQVVEHFRNLWHFVRVITEKDDEGSMLCNKETCPKMSAGHQSFTWLNKERQPVELPANEYITLMQRWITGKIDNPVLFPTDCNMVSEAPYAPKDPANGGQEWIGKSSGFPKDFFEVCQAIFRQMFRVYAHLYWAHYREPFYDLSLEKQLNSCFSHFVLTAMELDLMKPSELEPMQPLIDLWAANGTFPKESRAYANANLDAGRRLQELAERSG